MRGATLRGGVSYSEYVRVSRGFPPAPVPRHRRPEAGAPVPAVGLATGVGRTWCAENLRQKPDSFDSRRRVSYLCRCCRRHARRVRVGLNSTARGCVFAGRRLLSCSHPHAAPNRALLWRRVRRRCSPTAADRRGCRCGCASSSALRRRAPDRCDSGGPDWSMGLGGPGLQRLRGTEDKEAGGIAVPRSRRRECLTVRAPRA